MPQDIKQLTGRLNTDDSEEILAPGDHAMAYDLVFRGSGNNMRPENVKGNRAISNSLPSGTNICLGAIYSDKRQQLFYFNYNSKGAHAIYLYDLPSQIVTTLLAVGASTDGDVLLFDAAEAIPNIDIIYGDDTQGDILYWLNSQKQPCKLNIDRALGTLGTYGVLQRSYLDVIKAPPQIPPAVTFEDDDTVTVNNFRKKLMKFKYRYVYDDKDKSVWSAHSEIPLPIGYTDSNADLNADPTKNAKVAIVLQTGKPNVKKIEIAACEAIGNVFGDFFLIKVLDKEADGLRIESQGYINDVYSLVLAGTPATGDIVTIRLYQFGVAHTYSYTVIGGDTLADVVAALLALINATVIYTGASLTNGLAITAISGNPFIAPTGSTVQLASSIADDSLTTYRFYNDEAYTYIDVPESIQPFDEVPRKANAQGTLNGNVVAYGGILEGYNQIVSSATVTAETEEQIKTTQYPFVYIGTQSGNSGFGDGEILVKLIGSIPRGWTYHIKTTNYDITYTAQPNDTPTEVLAGLVTAAISDGFTGTSDDETLTITKAGESLQLIRVEPIQTTHTELAVSIDWSSGLSVFNINGFADRAYLFPVGSNFTLSSASTPGFNGTYHVTSNSSVDGIDLLLQTNSTVVPGTGSFTADVLSYPDQVTLYSLTGLSAVFYSGTSQIRIVGGNIYVATLQPGQTFTISGAGIGTFNRTYEIYVVNIDGADLVLGVSAFTGADPSSETVDLDAYILDTFNNPYTGTDSPVYDWWSRYSYAEIYFDENGYTPGATTDHSQSVQTIGYDDNDSTQNVFIPKNRLEINHRPPVWAKYFHIARTKNLTKSNFVQWISDHTYKDTEFAYISIEILNQYIVVNPQSNFLAWDFTPGDRIRFMKILSGSVNTIYTNKDYEIQASLTDPYINGAQVSGQILKIALPTLEDTFDFGGGDWENYLIEVYTPAKNVGNGLDLYYEFSERYMVGNPGTETRFHQGMLQNQSPDLVDPAVYEFIKGDNYLTERTLNVGNEIKYSVDNNSNTDPAEWFLGMTEISGFDVTDYTVYNQAFVATAGTIPATEKFIKILNGTFTFRIRGRIVVRVDDYVADPGITGTVRFLYSPFVVGTPGTNLGEQFGPFVNGQTLTFDIDATVTRSATDDGTMSIVISNRRIGPGGAFNLDYTIVSGYLTITQLGNTYTVGIQNPNYSFNYESAVNSNGRAWVVDADARENYNMVLMRYGLAYQQDTNINQVNRFYSTNFDEYDRSKGAIRRFVPRQRFMRVYQANGVGQVGIYSQFITNATGQQDLIYTNQIITQNNIQYYLGEFGMGDQNTGICSNKNADYFDDPVRGYELRVSNDGMQPISKLYKGQFYISRLITPYNYDWYRPDGSKAKILKVYDFFEEEAVTVLQSGSRAAYANALTTEGAYTDGADYGFGLGGAPHTGDIVTLTLADNEGEVTEVYTYEAGAEDDAAFMIAELIDLVNAGTDFTAAADGDTAMIATSATGNDIVGHVLITYADATSISDYTFSFNEHRNMYSSFFHYKPEWIIACEDILFSWLNGVLYIHDSETRANFYGVQYTPEIDLVFNSQIAIRKNFFALAYQSNTIWAAPATGDVTTSMINPQTGMRQESNLKTVDFEVQEGLRYAALKYDANSRSNPKEGIVNGDQLGGQWVKIKLQYAGSEYAFLFVPYIHFGLSGRNL